MITVLAMRRRDHTLDLEVHYKTTTGAWVYGEVLTLRLRFGAWGVLYPCSAPNGPSDADTLKAAIRAAELLGHDELGAFHSAQGKKGSPQEWVQVPRERSVWDFILAS